MRKVLLLVACASAFALPTVGLAETITGVTFTGPASNPTITVTGTGFDPEPVGSTAYPLVSGSTGEDFALDEFYIRVYNSSGGFMFTAGQDGDNTGLLNVNYSDTSITFQFGSWYTSHYGVTPTDKMEDGYLYNFGLYTENYCGVVNYGGATSPGACPTGTAGPGSVTPEPSSILMTLTGITGVYSVRRRYIRPARS